MWRTNDDGSIEVITAPNDYMTVKDALEAAGFKPEFGEVTMKPEGETELPATTPCACRNCSTRWKVWTTCRKSTARL